MIINGFKDWINKTINDMGFKKLTEIQSKTIPHIIKNKNVIGVSATGTGKTLSFVLPILNKLELNNDLQVIILSPTRELANQTYSVISKFTKYQKSLKHALLIGGSDINKQIQKINNNKVQILIATPARLKELLLNKKIDCSKVNTIVLDEADMILDLGFFKDLDTILNILPNDSQKLIWSATLHELLINNLSKYISGAKIIKVGQSIYENKNIKHFVIHHLDKFKSLEIFTKTIKPYISLIFANNKKDIKNIMEALHQLNINAIAIHGGLSSRERKTTYNKIKNLEYQYIVASDLASRGLDIDGVSHVISWDLPDDPEWYVHRSGRSGRSKYTGESYLFYDGKNDDKLKKLESKGIIFNHYKIKNNTLNEISYEYKKKVSVLDKQTQLEISKISNKKQKVKPNYKKKKKQEIKKIKQKSKRKYLEKKINEQRIKKYKQDNS